MSALREHGKTIRTLHAEEELWAISYDIIPWDPYIALAFRLRSESNYPVSDVSADWKHCELIGDHNCKSLVPARDFAHQACESVGHNSKQGQDVAHLIYLAAADALLDQGQRTLNSFSGKDLRQEVVAPAATAAFHGDAFRCRVLFQER